MLVNDQDIQVLYEACSSKDCTKACNKEVGVTVVCLFCHRSFLDQLSSGTSCLKDFHHCLSLPLTFKRTPNEFTHCLFVLLDLPAVLPLS